MALFGQDDEDLARRNLAPSLPATLGETAATAWNSTWQTQTALGTQQALRDRYQGYIDQVHEMTGERLDNPMDAAAFGQGDIAPDFITATPRQSATDQAESEFADKVTTLGSKFPDMPVRDGASIRAEIANDRRLVREQRAEVAGREHGFLSGAVELGTSMAAQALDPPVLASMFFGAPVASSILRAALTDAAVGAGSEAVVQGVVQGGRAQFGEQPNLGEAAESVALAAGGGGGLSLAFRGLARGARVVMERVRRGEAVPSDLADAAAHVERQADLEDANPFPDTPVGRAEHQQRMDIAIEAARDGQAPDFTGREISTSDTAPPIPRDASVPSGIQLRSLEETPDLFEAALAADVEREFAGREHEPILVEDADGSPRSLTFADMKRDFEMDNQLLETFRSCAGG